MFYYSLVILFIITYIIHDIICFIITHIIHKIICVIIFRPWGARLGLLDIEIKARIFHLYIQSHFLPRTPYHQYFNLRCHSFLVNISKSKSHLNLYDFYTP